MDPRGKVSWRALGLLCMLLSSPISSFAADDDSDQTIYLVQVSTNPPGGKDDPKKSHEAYLAAALGSNDTEHVTGCLIYCYSHVFNGFAAALNEKQAARLSDQDGVLSVRKNHFGKVTTTNSWRFLGVESRSNPLTGALWEKANFGQDAIIGVIDSGIWPESASFSDEGIGPIPARWKGQCVEGDYFTKDLCNRKLIGAKFFLDGNPAVTNETWAYDYKSARDVDGHGTHVASTAAGNFARADINGYANGTAKGGAPHARIAVYKVCWTNAACSYADMVAAIDEAIADGVDVLSISISGLTQTPFYQDIVAIASFHAMRNGILVNFAGGNDGPSDKTVAHVDPWVLTVGAATQDRFLGAEVHIGLEGNRLPALKLRGSTRTNYSTVTAPIARLSSSSSKFCFNGTLDPSEVHGKIVLCLIGDYTEALYEKAETVKAAGGVGIIVGNADETLDFALHFSPDFAFPGVLVTTADASSIEVFISAHYGEFSSEAIEPVATIFSGRTFKGVKPSPVLADFSSRGPSSVTADILKPDITAPGVDILAAYTEAYGPYPYLPLSGTSMATPHIAGVAALLKSINPRWSPAAIKSAIMTSARHYDNTNKPIKDYDGEVALPFSVGSGFVNPSAAANPGLIYDAGPRDYTLFLCALGYSDQNVEVITGEKDFCSSEKYFPSASDLNYPSLSVANLTDQTTTVFRRVANVGKAKSVYLVSLQAPEGVKVTISPSILRFTRLYETKSFTVKLQRTVPADYSTEMYVFGSYTWSSGHYKVRSPIVIGTQPFNSTSL